MWVLFEDTLEKIESPRMFSQILCVLSPLPKSENCKHGQACPCRHCKPFYLCKLNHFDVVDIVGQEEPPSTDVEFDSSSGIVKQFALRLTLTLKGYRVLHVGIPYSILE